MQVVLGLIVLLLVIALAGVVFRLLFRALAVVATVAVAIPFAPALCIGFGLERGARFFRSGGVLAVAGAVVVTGWAAGGIWSGWSDTGTFDAATVVGVGIFTLLAAVTTTQMIGQRVVRERSLPLPCFEEKVAQTHALLLAGSVLLLTGVLVPQLGNALGLSPGQALTVQLVYLVAAVLSQVVVSAQMAGRRQASDAFFRELSLGHPLHAERIVAARAGASALDDAELASIFDGIAARWVLEGRLRELELAGGRWFFSREGYDAAIQSIDGFLADAVRHHPVSLARVTAGHLGLPKEANDDFIERHLQLGQHLRFAEGVHYVSFRRLSDVRVCVSCGFAEVSPQQEDDTDWFCSKICRKTEDICDTLQRQSREEFLSEAAKQGFVVMAGASTWSANHKMFAAGGQGHGFAAEAGNHQADILRGRKARVVGGDNALNGADRLVDGQLIQTKYCKTPGSSVGQGFGPDGMYRYVDAQNRPMQLEVPRDQYDRALVAMRKRMKAGKVLDADGRPMPPEQAETILRKGALTYEQARNITRFGTLESIGFDVIDGAVVGAVAGGISFGVCAFMYYVNTRDQGASLRAAFVQGGRTFGSTMLVHVGAQQLHRLAMVQKALAVIDFSSASPTTLRVLRDGLGVRARRAGEVAGINKAVRGTVVTSLVLVLATTGPDMIRLMRGRISRAQFFKNAAVGVSGITGGTVGSILGGAALSPLGPAGMIAGRVAGGALGGLLAASIARFIADELVEDDRVAMLAVVREQMEYLAKAFMLSPEELDNFNANLEKVVTARMLESLYAEKGNRHALANHYLKPTVVGVVKQRPAFGFAPEDVARACDLMAA